MISYVLMLVAAAATIVSAATPSGFEPSVSADLVVDYNNTLIDGQVVAMNLVQTLPRIGSTRRLNGSSYAVLMLDLDIPTNVTGQTSTLLHWMQTGLTPAVRSTHVGRQAGRQDAVFFLLLLLQNGTGLAPAAAAAYIGPSPPARVPLSHRYTQLLVDTSGLATSSQSDGPLSVLTSAAASRQGFDALQVLQSAGLLDRLVAANFFNVTNPGPVSSSSSSSSSSNSNNSIAVTAELSAHNATRSSQVTASASSLKSSQAAGVIGFVLLLLLL